MLYYVQWLERNSPNEPRNQREKIMSKFRLGLRNLSQFYLDGLLSAEEYCQALGLHIAEFAEGKEPEDQIKLATVLQREM